MVNRHYRLLSICLLLSVRFVAAPAYILAADAPAVSLENTLLKYVIASDGHNLHFIDRIFHR